MHRQLKLTVLGAVAGLIGSAVKAKAEPVLQGLFEARFPPGPGEKDLVGADPKGQPENMPPSVMIERAGEALTGHELPAGVLATGQQAIHYGFGTGAGVVYTVLADHLPLATLGGGAIPGLLLYGATHGSLFAAIGVQPPPRKMPKAAVGWEATSHVVYGMTVELVRRLGTAVVVR